MNKARRAELDKVQAMVDTIISSIEEARDMLENLKQEEEDYKDNMPESLQSGDKYQNAESAVDAMQEAFDILDNAANELGNIADHVSTAQA